MEIELQDFIQGSFKSVWALELLVFLKRRAGGAWTTADLVREMRGSEPVVLQSVAMLQAAGLVAQDAESRVVFAPASADLRALADAAERAYDEKPAAVRRLILTGPNEKLHTLADAFRLRKDRP
ncbi:hypothetical protein [Salinarimonas soli]|uniref:hypothetical protein n=1 Tax=Salinarimonas soli TaxID=1638099 RepID=UPI001661E546|nr:hypothetical protein [Salinarimonas soli]